MSFVEFARRKLEKTTEYSLIKTNVIIDGMIHSDKLELMADDEIEKADSVSSFVKVQMEGSLSSLSITSNGMGLAKKSSLEAGEPSEDKVLDMIVGGDEDPRMKELEEEFDSTLSQAGTRHPSVKTFKSQSQQTKPEDDLNLKGIPARFEGSMVTPVYFEGRMLTPEKLDQMLSEAAKKKGALTIPVSFEGGDAHSCVQVNH